MLSDEQKKAAKEAAKRLEANFPGVYVGTGIMKNWWGKLVVRLFVWTPNSPNDLPKDFPSKWEGFKVELRQTPKAL